MATAPLTQAQLMQLNMGQRQAVLANAVEMTQQIASVTVNPTQQTVININPRNVGLIKGFIVEVTAALTNTAAGALAITPMGSANILKNVTFTDLSNVQRINVPGWYLGLLNSARQGFAFGGAYSPNMSIGYGNNWNVNSGPSSVAISTSTSVRQIYYVPLAYAADDLRGSIYAAIVSATMQLQLTVNPNPCVAAGGDLTGAVYSGNAAATYTAGNSVTVTVYQVFLDQIPQTQSGPILPIADLNTVYELKQTPYSGFVAGQDFQFNYANFRDFLSTTVVYNNAGTTLNGGSDINYFALTAANSTNLFKVSPEIAALNARNVFMADPPLGTYYFSHRNRPINTITFGNMQLNLNPSAAPSNTYAMIGFEAFAQVNTITGSAAQSLT